MAKKPPARVSRQKKSKQRTAGTKSKRKPRDLMAEVQKRLAGLKIITGGNS